MISYRKMCIDLFWMAILRVPAPLQTSPLCTLLFPKSYYTLARVRGRHRVLFGWRYPAALDFSLCCGAGFRPAPQHKRYVIKRSAYQ